jgi:Ca2+-binding RTX toxin-like protein
VLTGVAGNDVLKGGTGADALSGGTGNDDYLFARGYGADTLTDNDATAGNSDRLIFSGVSHDQLWFRSLGNNLEVSVIGTTDKVSISNWNLGAANHVEQIRAADGLNLSDTQVANLVNAMAAFAPPSAGQTSLSTNYHTALDSVIAANWS